MSALGLGCYETSEQVASGAMGQALCHDLQIGPQIGRQEAVGSIQRLIRERFGEIRHTNSRMAAISGLMPMMLITRVRL
jgi:hypothetical protein